MKDETANSSVILREAVTAIQKKFPGKTTGEVLAGALVRRAKVSEASAEELGSRVDRIIANPGEPAARRSQERLYQAVQEIFEKATVDYTFDVPALAGYASDNPLKVYIDKGLKRNWTLASGREIDVAPYLVLHEVIEKTLIDELEFSERGYQRSHQIAQRLEQEAVRADKISWKEYQYLIMIPEIDRAYTHRAFSLPPDLDVLPYRDTNDLEILGPVTRKFFSISRVADDIYHITFESGIRMAGTLMRFQEFYESPKFRGQYFTREEFNAWYSTEKNGMTYIQNWAEEGFNFPSFVLEPFYEGYFSPLTADESEFLEYFKSKRGRPFYMISTAKDSRATALRHEIAHALYHLNVAYRKEVTKVLATIDSAPIKKFLTTNPDYASYHEAVLTDEVPAYLCQSSDELEEHGVEIAPYRSAIEQLQEIYKHYTPWEV